MAILNGEVPQPVGATYRDFGADWFNASNIAREDWQRQEQSNMLAFERESAFNSAEAQKNREWQEKMSNTSYQRVMEDLKKAGLNPILAYDNGGASTPSSSPASASSQGKSYKGGVSSGLTDTVKLLGTVVSIAAGLYSAGATNATNLAIAKQRGNAVGKTVNINIKK